MYLTRMELDLKNRQTVLAIASPSILHGMVETAFSGERKRNLWRIDTLHEKTYLILLSTERPEMMNIYSQIGIKDNEECWQIKDYDSYISGIQTGEVFHFRLIANPTYSHYESNENSEKSMRGKVYAHITTEHQKKWLMDRADGLGFILNENRFDVTEKQWKSFQKGKENGRPVDILSVTYEGELRVKDADRFRETLKNGIGRGKAYGMGLLTVIRR